MPWVRSGSCKRAVNFNGMASCCINYQPQPGGANECHVAEAAALTGVVGSNVAGACPLYQRARIQGKYTGFCAGHEPPNQHAFYLRICKDWPRTPDDIVNCPSCQECYQFTWVP